MNKKVKERLLALLTALVLLLTLVGSLAAFAMTSGAIDSAIKKYLNILIFAVIALNAILSAVAFFYIRSKLTANIEPKKAYTHGALALASILLDVVALVLALLAATPSTYVFLGVVLIVDVAVDAWIHFNRSEEVK